MSTSAPTNRMIVRPAVTREGDEFSEVRFPVHIARRRYLRNAGEAVPANDPYWRKLLVKGIVVPVDAAGEEG